MIGAKEKRYLGDGVYVAHNGFHLVLTTGDRIRATNTIYLEPEVWAELLHAIESWCAEDKRAAQLDSDEALRRQDEAREESGR